MFCKGFCMLAEGWTGFDGDAKENLTWGCVGDCEDEMKALGGLDSVMRTRSSNYLWSGLIYLSYFSFSAVENAGI